MDNVVTFSHMSALQGKKEIVVGSKVSQVEAEMLQKVCDDEDRSMSYVLRELAMRGLAQYFRDGQLKANDADAEVLQRIQLIRKAGGMRVAPKSKSSGIVLGNPRELTQKRREDAPQKKKNKRLA